MRNPLLAFLLLLGTCFVAQAKEENKLYELSVRASAINPDAKEHPEINYNFAKVKDKYQDMQHAIVDTRVPSSDRLVIWLMSYNAALSEYLASLGLHLIQHLKYSSITHSIEQHHSILLFLYLSVGQCFHRCFA